MGRIYDHIDERLNDWIMAQHVFFVASAPNEGGHVNLSPKGLDTLSILDEDRVAYLDLTGSGAETIAHVRENGRLTMMFCAFDGPPRIVRLHGRGSVVALHDPGYAELAGGFPDRRGARAVIVLDVERIADSCGFGVPLMDYVADRDSYERYTDHKTDDEIEDYRVTRNATSIDGLPAWDPLTV
jgi:Pyridoxamine 5'-phosphate oxidase